MAARYVDFMIASISAHSTNIASTIIHAYHYNLSLYMCHVQPTVYQLNSYCIRDIHVTEAICSCTPISHASLIYGIPFTHADILIFSCESDLLIDRLRTVHSKRQTSHMCNKKLSFTHTFNYIVLQVNPGLTSCEDLPTALLIVQLISNHNITTTYRICSNLQ